MAIATPSNITAECFRQAFDYIPDIGELKNKQGMLIKPQRRILKAFGEAHVITRFIWLHYYGEWPPSDKLVDHKDRNQDNDCIGNLRLASYSENGFNMWARNPHGYKGITYQHGRPMNCWLAQIRLNGKKVNLGRYETKEEAAAIYREVALQYHGEFACLE